MKKSAILCTSAFVLSLAGVRAEVPAKVNYNDHVLPILKNACLNCHNPDKKKAGLDLSTYQATLMGSDNGKVLESGNAGASLLFKCVKQTEDPKMPPKGDKLTDSDLAILEKWIVGQLLESANGKAVVASNNVQLAVVSLEKPVGPPPMPGDLPLEPFVRPRGNNALVALASSPWAPLVAIGGQKQIVLYNTDTLQPLGVLPFPEGFPAVIRFSRNGKLLLTGGGLGGKSGECVLWDVQTGERAGVVGNEFDQVLAADISPDHGHVALGGPGRLLKVYSTKDGKLEHTIKKHTDWVTAIAFSPDGKYLASADRAGAVVVWEGSTGKEFNTLAGHKVGVTALAFMPGVLASASQDGTVVLWDVKEGKEIRKWNAHPGGVEWVDFTPDGRLVTCGRDRLAKVWDQTGKALFTSAQFADIALRAALSNDRVVAGDWTGAISVFALEGAKKLGEITANPPPLAEQLAAAQKRLEDVKGTIPGLEQALAAAEEKALAQNNAAEPVKPEADVAKKVEQANAELAKLREERAQKAEGSAEFAAANEKVQATKAELATLQAAQPAQAAAPAPAQASPAAAQALAKAKADLEEGKSRVASATTEVERWQRAQSFMRVHTARQTFSEKKARYDDLLAASKDAFAPVEQMKTEISAAEKAVADAPAQIKGAGQALAEAQAAVETVRKATGAAEKALVAAEESFKAATQAAEKMTAEMADMQKKAQAADQQVVAAQKEVDKLTVEVAQLREARSKTEQGSTAYGEADARVQAMKQRIADATTKLDSVRTDAQAAKAFVEGAPKKQDELKAAALAAKVEAAKTRESLDKLKADLTAAADRATVADRAVAKAKQAAETSSKRLAELRKKLPEAARDAQLAKVTAEKEAATLAKELESAKAQAERAKLDFDAKYRPAQKAAASQTGTSGQQS